MIQVDTAQPVATMNGSPTYVYPFNGRPIAPLKKNATAKSVVQTLREILSVSSYSRCQVWEKEDEQFQRSIIIFNGAVKSPAVALVKPHDAEDVSKVIKFCRQNDLEISVKAGGTGVHGWSVAGHVIIDLALMNHVTVHKPSEAIPLEESFANLRLDSNGEDSIPNIPKRPSLSTSNPSTETATLKRGSADEGQVGHDSKRRADLIDRANRSMSDSIQDLSSASSASGSGSGSGSSRPSGSRSGSQPTLATSLSSHERSQDGKDPSPTFPSSSSSSRSNSTNGVRVTYVNPSPTVSTSHPFVTPPFGAETTSSVNSPTLMLNTHPNPPDHTIVTFGAGVHSKQLDSTTARSPYGAFHVPTSAFPVGSGQFVLGGFGFMGRQYGLAMDNVVEAEMVLGDGRIVWVGEGGTHGGEWKDDEDPNEVWWALRGAGPALGVITRFRAKAYYLPSVFAGNLIYIFDRQTAPSLLRHVRDVVKGSPRRQYTNIIMTAGPPGAPAIIVIQLCSSGPKAEGEQYLQAISSWEGGRCMFQDFSERTFERQQLAVEEILKGGQGKKWYIKSDMLMSLDDSVIDQTCERFSSVPDGCTWLFEYTGGGIQSEVKDSCYPISHREGHFTVAALHQWGHNEAPSEDNRCVTTAEHWINEVIHPHSPGGPLPCFLQSSKHDDVAAVYGDNFARLARVKAMVDPGNVFKHTFWPRPDGPGEERLLGRDSTNGDTVEHLADGELSELEREQYDRQRGLGGLVKGKGRAVPSSSAVYEGIQDLGHAISGKKANGDDGMDGLV